MTFKRPQGEFGKPAAVRSYSNSNLRLWRKWGEVEILFYIPGRTRVANGIYQTDVG